MIEIFKFQAFEQVRECFKSNMRLPRLPDSRIISSHKCLLDDMKGQMFQGIETSPLLGGWSRTDASDRGWQK